jgi:hypothetical protein
VFFNVTGKQKTQRAENEQFDRKSAELFGHDRQNIRTAAAFAQAG